MNQSDIRHTRAIRAAILLIGTVSIGACTVAEPVRSTAATSPSGATGDKAGPRQLWSGGPTGMPLTGPPESWTSEQKARAEKLRECVAEQKAKQDRKLAERVPPGEEYRALADLAAGNVRKPFLDAMSGPECAKLTKWEQLDAVMLHTQANTDAAKERNKLELAERLKRQAAAKPLSDKAGTRWAACAREATITLARNSAETAETVVKAAFGACAKEELEFDRLWSEAEGRSMTRAIEIAKDNLTPTWLALVMANRAAAATQRENPPTVRPLTDYRSM